MAQPGCPRGEAVGDVLGTDGLVPSRRDRRGQIRTLGPDHAVQTRAATVVLDRTGMRPSSTAKVHLSSGVRLAALINEPVIFANGPSRLTTCKDANRATNGSGVRSVLPEDRRGEPFGDIRD